MAEVGASALYLMVQRCIRSIATEVLGRPGYEPSLPELERVEAMCTQPVVQFMDRLGNSAFPGPRHLASLLKAVGRELPADSLARLKAPPGVDALLWNSGLAHIAKTRPYLWENHREMCIRDRSRVPSSSSPHPEILRTVMAGCSRSCLGLLPSCAPQVR